MDASSRNRPRQNSALASGLVKKVSFGDEARGRNNNNGNMGEAQNRSRAEVPTKKNSGMARVLANTSSESDGEPAGGKSKKCTLFITDENGATVKVLAEKIRITLDAEDVEEAYLCIKTKRKAESDERANLLGEKDYELQFGNWLASLEELALLSMQNDSRNPHWQRKKKESKRKKKESEALLKQHLQSIVQTKVTPAVKKHPKNGSVLDVWNQLTMVWKDAYENIRWKSSPLEDPRVPGGNKRALPVEDFETLLFEFSKWDFMKVIKRVPEKELQQFISVADAISKLPAADLQRQLEKYCPPIAAVRRPSNAKQEESVNLAGLSLDDANGVSLVQAAAEQAPAQRPPVPLKSALKSANKHAQMEQEMAEADDKENISAANNNPIPNAGQGCGGAGGAGVLSCAAANE